MIYRKSLIADDLGCNKEKNISPKSSLKLRRRSTRICQRLSQGFDNKKGKTAAGCVWKIFHLLA